MLCCTTFQKSVLFLILCVTSVLTERNIIIRALTETSVRNQKSAQDESGPSIPITTKPPCPSYITCPYPPYPRPTTKPSLPNENSSPRTTTSTTEKMIVEYIGPESNISPLRPSSTDETDSKIDKPSSEDKLGNANSPSISATTKPPCPSYITCPYPPYPRPTTKKPLQEESVITSTTSTKQELVAEYFGKEKETTTDNSSTPNESSTKPVFINKPGNAQGPSISATSKPPCPSYITCPYPPYPRPTTKKPSQKESVTTSTISTTSTKQELVTEYFGKEKEKTTDNFLIPNESSTKPVFVNKPGNAQGPSISATSKPPCPSYISCPYPSYPRPTTKNPKEESSTLSSTTSSPEKGVVEYFGPDETSTSENPILPSESSVKPSDPHKEKEPAEAGTLEHSSPSSEASLKPNEPTETNHAGNAQGPSISATSKPPCPSYISCPYPSYPRPTTKSPKEESSTLSSTTSSPEKGVVEYFGPDETSTSENPLLPSESSVKPSDPHKEKEPAETSLLEHSSPSSETSLKPNKPIIINHAGNAHGPSISATLKPPCSSYISCPYPSYPRPTTKFPFLQDSPSSIKLSELVSQYFGSEINSSPDHQSSSESTSSLTDAPHSETTTHVAYGNNAIATVTQYEQNGNGNKPAIAVISSTDLPEVSSLTSIAEHSVPVSELNDKTLIGNPDDWHFPGPSNDDDTLSLSDRKSEAGSAEVNAYVQDAIYINSGPSISATQRPLCSPYAACPYQYPKPTTTPPLIYNKISGTSFENLQTTTNPSISPNIFPHTSISNYNGAISPESNPLLHRNPPIMNSYLMNPVGSKTPQYTLTRDPVALGNQGAFLPFYTYVYGLEPLWENANYYNPRPSALLTANAVWPSYLKNPWIYSRPFGNEYVYDEQDSTLGSDEETDNSSSDIEEGNKSNSDIENESDQ